MVVKIRHQAFLADEKKGYKIREKNPGLWQSPCKISLGFPTISNPHFVLSSDMRRDVQEVFRMTPHEKQVMMFSATLAKEIRPVCKKFMQDVIIPPKFHCQVCC